jgi:PAS domain S-box-containing protein
MKDTGKTKRQLMEELGRLRRRAAELEAVEAEHKRAERELKLRDQVFDEIVHVMESAVDPIFLHDAEGNFIYVNEASARSHGYTKDELLKINLHKLEVNWSSKVNKARMKKIMKDRSAVFELEHYHKDGSILPFEIHTRPVELDGNLFFISATRDIGARKRAEEALKDGEARYRYLFEYSQVANALVGLDGKIIDVNQAAAELYGYDKSEIIGKYLLDFIAPESREKVAEAFARGLAGTHADPVEVEVAAKGGRRTFFFPGGYHTLFEGGKEAGFLISVVDVTELKKAEEALADEAIRRRILFGNARDGIVVLDEEARVVEANKRFADMLGYTLEEVRELHVWDWDIQSTREELLEMMRTVDEAGALLETRHRRKDDSVYDVDISANGAVIAGQKLIFCVCRDVTERKRAEEERRQLEQRAQFTDRLASVGELAAGVAHEMNNPLTGVIGYSHLLLDRKDIPEDVRRDVEVIYSSAQRVSEIIKKLLLFARRTRPERKYVDINGIINTTLELRAYSLQKDDLKVVLQLDPDLPMTVADLGQLQQVFLNLIRNVETEVKSVPGGGELTIRTEQIDNSIRISFTDNGPGIAREDLERIFDPFFTTRDVGQGTGLGLSVCHGIVTDHKGRIWAESQLGKGATFIVELPIVKTEQPVADA